MKRACALIHKLFNDKRARFVFVGGLNTVIGYGFFSLFIFLGVHYLLATTLSTAIGIVNSYFWNKYFTFRTPRRSKMEMLRFVSVYAVSFLLNLGVMKLFVDVWQMNSYLAGAVALVFTTLISYSGHNFFSFKSD